jgi:hypothetical protein
VVVLLCQFSGTLLATLHQQLDTQSWGTNCTSVRATVREIDCESDNMNLEITVITVASESFVSVLKILSKNLVSS